MSPIIVTVHDIVEAALKKHGYDGLFFPGECSCKIGDLMPCNSDCSACQPGYLQPCDCGESCEWHIGAEKPVNSEPSGISG